MTGIEHSLGRVVRSRGRSVISVTIACAECLSSFFPLASKDMEFHDQADLAPVAPNSIAYPQFWHIQQMMLLLVRAIFLCSCFLLIFWNTAFLDLQRCQSVDDGNWESSWELTGDVGVVFESLQTIQIRKRTLKTEVNTFANHDNNSSVKCACLCRGWNF